MNLVGQTKFFLVEFPDSATGEEYKGHLVALLRIPLDQHPAGPEYGGVNAHSDGSLGVSARCAERLVRVQRQQGQLGCVIVERLGKKLRTGQDGPTLEHTGIIHQIYRDGSAERHGDRRCGSLFRRECGK